MNHPSIYFLLVCCMLFCSCSSSKKKNQDLSTTDHLESQPPSSDDVSPQQNSPQQDSPKQNMPPAPGSVKLRAEVLNMEEASNSFHCTLKIITIHGYGANTPPLPEGTEIQASVSKEVLQNSDPNDTSEDSATMVMASGDTKNLTLKYQQVPKIPGNTSLSWRILSIR